MEAFGVPGEGGEVFLVVEVFAGDGVLVEAGTVEFSIWGVVLVQGDAVEDPPLVGNDCAWPEDCILRQAARNSMMFRVKFIPILPNQVRM